MQRQPPQSEEDNRQATFARLATEHARFLYRVAWSVLRHAQDAEDCVQDALLKLYRGQSWQQMTNERAFLASVVWRLALDRRSARPRVEQDAELQLADPHDSPENAAAEDDERQLLRELISELPQDLRDTLRLSALQELNSREIGELMGVPEGTVRTRLMRARTELQTRWTARRREAISSR